jgi:outer membrane lipoprotein SlyB
VGCASYRIEKEIPMRNQSRFAALASCAAVAALAAGCTSERTVVHVPPQPVAVVPAATPATVVPAPVAVAPIPAVERGRVTNIEYFAAGTATSRITVPAAVVAGRNGTAVLGGPPAVVTTAASYRITMLTDAGIYRTYDVPSTGDIRVGDRIRVENGVIYLS